MSGKLAIVMHRLQRLGWCLRLVMLYVADSEGSGGLRYKQQQLPQHVSPQNWIHLSQPKRLSCLMSEQITKLAIVTINSWDRIAIATRAVPGTYEPPVQNQQAAEAMAVWPSMGENANNVLSLIY